jgi:hypothetical protein
MKTNTSFRWIAFLTLLALLSALVPGRAQPLAAQEPPGRVPAHQAEGPKSSFSRLPAAQDPGSSQAQVLHAAEANIAQSSDTYTWTQTSQADWEQGALESLDSTFAPGSLKLAQHTFSPNQPVSPWSELASVQWEPDIAVDTAGNAYAVWWDERNGDADIYFAYRPVGGVWSANARVNDDSGTEAQTYPAIAVDASGNAYAVWTDWRSGDSDVYFAYRPAGGMWGANVRVNDDTGSAWQSLPDIAVDGAGNAYAVWEDNRSCLVIDCWLDADIYSASRPASGPWGTNVKINDNTAAADCTSPGIAVNAGGVAYAVWSDNRDGDADIYSAPYLALGVWGTNAKVNDDIDSKDQKSPALIVDSAGNAYAVWADGRNEDWNSDIYCAYRPVSGMWGNDIKVNDDTGIANQRSPSIALDDSGNAYAVWEDGRNEDYGYDIYFAYRPTGGGWSANARVNDDVSDPLDGVWQAVPAIAIDGSGNAYVVWEDERSREDDADIYFAHRPAGGTWTTNERIDDALGTATQYGPDIAVDGVGNAYAVWADRRNGDSDVYFAYRPAGGTWSEGVRVNDDPGAADQWSPTIAVDGAGNAYALWTDERNGGYSAQDIYFAYRPAGGSWSANAKVNDTPSAPEQWVGNIAVDGAGNAYAIWDCEIGEDYDVYFAYRPAGGSWGASVKVNDDVGTEWQLSPHIAVDEMGNAYAVWEDDRNGNSDIYFAHRPVGGVWSTNVQINDDVGTASQEDPAIAVDGSGNAYAVWWDGRDSFANIYYSYRPAGGAWGANVKVNGEIGYYYLGSYWPNIAVDNAGNAYAVWQDYLSNAYAAYQPVGGTWGNPTKVSDGPGHGYLDYSSPVVAMDSSSNAYILWPGERGAFDLGTIYFTYSLPKPEYWPEGTYTSPIFDAGVVAAWETLAWTGTTPTGTALSFETRSRLPGGAWSAWMAANSPIVSPPGQFCQYRVGFSTLSADTTPSLDQMQITYRAVDTPSAPRFVTPCGVTNQTNPTLRGSAAAGAFLHLYVDGSEVMTTTAGLEGGFLFTPTLSIGSHTLTAAAENVYGTGPASGPLALTVDPTLPYDPIGVRAGQWSKDGWLLAPPRDTQGCANPNSDWQVWPRSNQAFRVEVPVTYATSAAVSVTVGMDTIALTEVTTGTFAGVLAPPITAGVFRLEVTADGATIVVDGGPVLIDPDGVVYQADGTLADTIPGVQVTLYYSDTHTGLWLPWDAWTYDQINPQMTLDDGYYSFYTPPGTYQVVASKTGYATYTSPDLVVIDHPVRHNVPLGSPDWQIYLPLVSKN